MLLFVVTQCSKATASLSLGMSRRSNSERLKRFKMAADTFMAFAGEFFTEEIERQSHFVLFKLESALYSPHAIKPEKMSRSFLAVVACKHVFPAVTGKTSGFAGYGCCRPHACRLGKLRDHKTF